MEFTELKLHPDLQRGIDDAGYKTCMPVQEQVLTHAFGGQDLYVQSQTGTGKTAAYLIVILQRLLSEPLLGGKKALIMVPTRELAVQVEQEAKILGKYLPFQVGSFYGGVGYAQQQKLLRENAQVLVGTPGRVLDLNGSGQMNLMDLSFLILDEADRMFDMGFYPDLRKLIKVVPPVDRRQTMLFSATLNAWVKNLAWEYTKNPLEIEIAPEKVTVEEVEQVLYHVPNDQKMKLLLGILRKENPESAIIFCNTKRFTEIIAKRLKINGMDCEFIIGDLPQMQRLKIIENLKAGKLRFLVATDVAARGLDIEGLAMVINYDLPNESENYVHRIGRTARAGKTGKAISLVGEQDVYELPSIEKYLGKKIPSQVAAEDFYGEDTSEGMRIRSDVYENRYEERSDYRSDNRSRRPSRPRSRSEGRPATQGEGRGMGQKSGPNAQRHNDAQPMAKRPAPVRRGEKENRSAAKTDLSHLPLEDRMAYYKRKYEADETNRRGKPPAGNRPAQDRKGRGKPVREKTTVEKPKTPVQKVQITPQVPKKKSGILDKIFGLFRRGSKE